MDKLKKLHSHKMGIMHAANEDQGKRKHQQGNISCGTSKKSKYTYILKL